MGTQSHMRDRQRGFSTLELVVAMTVIAITAALAMPRFAASTQRTKLERAADLLASDITRVRENAKAYGLSQTISFSGTSYTITTNTAQGSSTRTVDLTKEPFALRLDATRTTGISTVTFNPYGLPDATASFGLRAGYFFRVVTVMAGSGEVMTTYELPSVVVPATNTTLDASADAAHQLYMDSIR